MWGTTYRQSSRTSMYRAACCCQAKQCQLQDLVQSCAANIILLNLGCDLNWRSVACAGLSMDSPAQVSKPVPQHAFCWECVGMHCFVSKGMTCELSNAADVTAEHAAYHSMLLHGMCGEVWQAVEHCFGAQARHVRRATLLMSQQSMHHTAACAMKTTIYLTSAPEAPAFSKPAFSSCSICPLLMPVTRPWGPSSNCPISCCSSATVNASATSHTDCPEQLSTFARLQPSDCPPPRGSEPPG